MKSVLLLTHHDDPHSKSVREYFDQKSVDYYEVHTDRLIDNYKLTFDLSKKQFELDGPDRKISLDSSWNIWNRRVMDPDLPTGFDKKLENIVYTETERTWEGLLTSHPGKVVNRPQHSYAANNKVNQLLYASNYGNNIHVPKTVLSNDPEKIKQFYNTLEKVSFKLLKAPIIETNDSNDYLTCYNNIVEPEHLQHLDTVKNNPSLFQEYIEKEYELRITAVEGKAIGIRINSQDSPLSRTDFRRYDFKNVTYAHEELPKNVETFCLDMLKHYNLSFGEFDFIKNKKGEYVFLEINPNGQWLWLELKSGFPLTKTVAENLL